MPALPTHIQPQLARCPHCDSDSFSYVTDNFRRGVVLDPFCGSGTTLAVAEGHGRDSIGVDLDSRNAELAYERVGGIFLAIEHFARA